MSPDDENPSPAGDPGLQLATIGFALRRAQVAVAEDFSAHFAPLNIRPAQFAVLDMLRHTPGLRQSQVSLALGIRRTNLVPLLDELEQRGLVERRGVPGDRRAAALFLTEAGADLVPRLAALAQAHEDHLAARLGPGGRVTLLGLLARLAEPAFDPP